MEEKEMVLDVLTGTKASIGGYAKCITECADQNLRQTFQQMRDSEEKFQYDLYKLASSKGFYMPATPASSSDMQQVKSFLEQSCNC